MKVPPGCKHQFSNASFCHGCQQRLDLADVELPKFGLVEVICSHCKYQHLFARHEIQNAVGRVPVLSLAPRRLGFASAVRRFIPVSK